MTAAASYQPALDGPVDGVYYGFFSYALARSLGSSSPAATPREIHDGVKRVLARLGSQFDRISMPDPQLEVPPGLRGRPVLRSAEPTGKAEPAAARLAWIEVQGESAGSARLVDGMTLGAVPGSTWAIYPPGETEFAPGEALAVATVSKLREKDAIAGIEPASFKPVPESRAVALGPPPGPLRVPLQFDRVDAELRTRLEQALGEVAPTVEVVGPGRFARFVVDVEDGKCKVYGAGGQHELASFAVEDERSTALRLAEIASRSLTVSELLALDNPLAKLRLDVQVLPTDDVGNSRAVKVVGAEVPAYRIRRADEPRSRANSLMLRVQASDACYLTVVDVDTEGGVHVLFPNVYSQRVGFYRNGYVPGGQALLLPDSLKKGNRAGFYWDYAEPAGIDTVRVFAATDLATANTIRRHIDRAAAATSALGRAATRGGRTAPGRSPFAALARELRAKAANPLRAKASAAGVEKRKPEAGPKPEIPKTDWTAATVTFLVED
jgi:hypothetical protein